MIKQGKPPPTSPDIQPIQYKSKEKFIVTPIYWNLSQHEKVAQEKLEYFLWKFLLKIEEHCLGYFEN